MSIWNTARGLLDSSVVAHLGEELTLAENGGDGEATVRGVLTRGEEIVRLGLSQMVAGDARLTLRTAHTPAWWRRGVRVTSTTSGEVYKVTNTTDNGEGMTEATLCRL